MPTLRVAFAMHPFAWTLLVSLTVLAGHADVAVAPFPPEHAYHWLNPWIEPWWVLFHRRFHPLEIFRSILARCFVTTNFGV